MGTAAWGFVEGSMAVTFSGVFGAPIKDWVAVAEVGLININFWVWKGAARAGGLNLDAEPQGVTIEGDVTRITFCMGALSAELASD